MRENNPSITRTKRDCETNESMGEKWGGVMTVVRPV